MVFKILTKGGPKYLTDHLVWFIFGLISSLTALNVAVQEVTKLFENAQKMLKSYQQLIKQFHSWRK
ncbi:hypothetical protein CP368_01345 [Lactobacillus sp. UMNPBX17]|nr:hypothetical protein CP368_01345 [Lactobacillus sp. UMNPBX17]